MQIVVKKVTTVDPTYLRLNTLDNMSEMSALSENIQGFDSLQSSMNRYLVLYWYCDNLVTDITYYQYSQYSLLVS